MNAAFHRRFRPAVHRLEDRAVPAGFTAASASDLTADIDAANATPEADTITLAAGKTFTLTAVNNTTDGANGLPVIAAGEDLTIVGNAAVIERSTTAGTPAFRLLDVAAGGTLTLQNLTLQGGLSSALGRDGRGGGVYNQGSLTLSGVIVQNNTSTAQGLDGALHPVGTFGGGLYSAGSLVMTGCTVQYNAAIGGAGMYFWGYPYPGGDARGGGVYVAGGTAVISHTTIAGNTAQGGAGADGSPGCDCDGFAQGGGGAGAQAGADGGDGLGGGVYVAGGTVTLRDTSVTGNVARGGAGGAGGKHRPNGAPGEGICGGLYIDPIASVSLDAYTESHVKSNKASTTGSNNIYGPYVIP
jgi:hypothetical protein